MSKTKINATHYEDIPPYRKISKSSDRAVNAVIETPKRSSHKYALNAEYGIIAFHEVLPDEMEWPFDYGFVPRTLADDGDPLDILVLAEEPLFSGCLIATRVLGAVRERKDGIENDRLIACPQPSAGCPQPTDAYYDVADIPPATLDKITKFLRSYSELQGHRIEVRAIDGAREAMHLIKRTKKAFERCR